MNWHALFFGTSIHKILRKFRNFSDWINYYIYSKHSVHAIAVGKGLRIIEQNICYIFTNRPLRWVVISHQSEDDHGDEVRNHADVKGDSSKLLPFGPQQLVDGLHCQHLMSILTTGPETQH